MVWTVSGASSVSNDQFNALKAVIGQRNVGQFAIVPTLDLLDGAKRFVEILPVPHAHERLQVDLPCRMRLVSVVDKSLSQSGNLR